MMMMVMVTTDDGDDGVFLTDLTTASTMVPPMA
jgi:hypothetical protein